MANQIINIGIYLGLLAQLNKLARHNRQGSFRTKERYYEAMKRFCAFLADAFRLQKLSNVNGKHLTAYILKLQDDGKAPSTIKTDLAAIRFFHDLMDAKYRLPDNDELKVALQRRTFGGVDRTWSREEFQRMLAEALRLGREDYVTILYLARYAGLRIHECFRIDTAIAARAVREGAITIKGKGGLVRTVPLHPLLVSRLELHLQTTPRGHKLFVPDGMETHTAIQHLQAFIRTYRPYTQDAGSTRPMTFHGLRHTCAAEWYQERISAGDTPYEARKAVSRLLGHGRDDVTTIYLASLQEPRTAAPLSGAAVPSKMDEQGGGTVICVSAKHTGWIGITAGRSMSRETESERPSRARSPAEKGSWRRSARPTAGWKIPPQRRRFKLADCWISMKSI